MARESVWTNSDGLRVGFGTRSIETTVAAAPSLGGQRQQLSLKIKGTDLADSDVARQLAYGAFIPAGSLLESAKLYVTTQFAGASAVMDIGVYNMATGAAVDDDGIDAAIATATLVADAVIACDGADIGTVVAVDTKIGVTYDTAAFTAGEATLVVEYVLPSN